MARECLRWTLSLLALAGAVGAGVWLSTHEPALRFDTRDDRVRLPASEGVARPRSRLAAVAALGRL
jgi:hypothetical protein